jgi:DNA-3-methyladenine glycosylase
MNSIHHTKVEEAKVERQGRRGHEALPAVFFDRDPRRVARELLGKLLVRRIDGRLLVTRIVETEAYLGKNDPAAHSSSGRTERNAVLFGPPGRAYVYFIYGNHYCLNVSCLPDGRAGGVLFRAVEPLAGIAAMAAARGLPGVRAPILTNGPGKLAEALGITREQNGMDLTDRRQSIYLAADDFPDCRVMTTPRIGITKAADLKLRYLICGNPFVSKSRGVPNQ